MRNREKPFVWHHYENRVLPDGRSWLYCRDCGRPAGNGPRPVTHCTDPAVGYQRGGNVRRTPGRETQARPPEPLYSEYWLLNLDNQEVYPLGPMYGGTVAYATRKLDRELLPYRWTLLAPMHREGD